MGKVETVSENGLEFAHFEIGCLFGLDYAHLSGQIRDPFQNLFQIKAAVLVGLESAHLVGKFETVS